MRHRNPEDVEKRSILVSERDLKKMRQDVYWRVRKTLGLKDVSCEQYEKTDIYMYRNEFKQEGFERLCEFIKNADPDGIGISIRLHIENANGYQLEKSLLDLAMIEASMPAALAIATVDPTSLLFILEAGFCCAVVAHARP